MSLPKTIKGIGSVNEGEWTTPKQLEYSPRKFNDEDILIRIEYCGVCGSDVHTISGGWGRYRNLVPGHEIVGIAEKVGSKVKTIKVGDTVGVGPMAGSCGECKLCLSDNEQYCKKVIGTYRAKNYKADNYYMQGGYATHTIVEENFVFPIPKEIPAKFAGPLMCAGLTVFSPLYKSLKGNGEGKLVGIVGIGGLGHLAIMFAKALGAKVVAFSRSSSKRQDSLDLGADDYVATGEDTDWTSKYEREFDIVLNCASSFTDINYQSFFGVLKVKGDFITVGSPEFKEMLDIHAFQLVVSGISLGGSLAGSKKEAMIMLDLAAKNKIFPVIEEIPLSVENVKQSWQRVQKSDVKYRLVLTGIQDYFSKAKL